MNGKKKYLVVALLLLLGVGAISFAGGNEDELEPVGGNDSKIENKEEVTEKIEDIITNEDDVNDNTSTNAIQNVSTTTNNGSNNTNNNEEQEEQVDLSLLVTNTEKMVYDALSKENVEEAKNYFDSNDIKELVSNLENSEIKENLQERVEELEKVFSDTNAPVISGIEPNEVTKENVALTITDELEFKTTVTLNEEEIEFSDLFEQEGEYTVKVVDKSQNATEIKFIIDKTNPTLNYSTLRLDANVYNENIDGTNYYYVKNGDVIEYVLAFNEKLLNAPKATIGGKEVTLALNPKETYRDEKRIYLYEGKVTFTEEDNIENGPLDIVVSEIIDLAGNETTDENILTPATTTNHRALMYDSVSPKVNYIAVLSKKEKYNEAIVGDTIRFLIQFNEEINLSSKTFKLKIDGKEISFVRSQGAGYEYIAEYKIPENTTLETGNLKFEIYGYQDKNRNGGETLTQGTHSKYNNVFFDGISPTITIVGNQGLNKNEHRILEGSRVYLSYVLATVTDNIDETIQIEPVSIKRYYPSETGKASHIYELEGEGEYKYFDTSNAGERYELKYEYTDSYGNKTTKTMLMPIDSYKNLQADENGIINVTKNINNGYIPFYNVIDNDKEITINGNNHTVTQEIKEEAFYWNETGNRSMLGNVFSSTNGSKITINDLTFKGTTGTISLGHYIDTKSNKYNTELNNVNIVGLNVVSYSAGLAPGVVTYGKTTFNNVNLYGTKLSQLDTNPAWPVWDLALTNYTTTNINNSKIGSVYTWAKTSITISNSEIDTIYSQSRKTSDMTTGGLTIENNSTVNKIVVANKNAIIIVKSGSVVDTIDYNGLSKANMTIIVEDGATVNNHIN